MGAGKLAKIEAIRRARSLNVFVSYSTEDLPGIRDLLQRAAVPGVDFFIAQDKVVPGTKLDVAIEREIKSCDLFVVMWSKSAAESAWVRFEVGIAVAAERKIVPILLDAKTEIPPYLANIKYIAAGQSITTATAELSGLLNTDLGAKRGAQSDKDALVLTLAAVGLLVAVAATGKK